MVEAWLDAVNEEDAAALAALSSEQIEIVGPRGQGMMDRSVLGQWLTRAGFSSRPLRWFCGADGRVVVERDALWHDVATRQRQDQKVIGSEFAVRSGRVVRFVRHDTGLADALAAAGLDETRSLASR